MNTKPVIALIVVAVLASLAGCSPGAETATSDSASSSDEQATASSRQGRIAYEQATEGSLMDLYTLPAEVVIPAETASQVGLQVGFRVDAWKVRTGQHVEMGDPIATVVSPELRDLASDLSHARRVFNERETVVQEQREAVESGFQSTQSLYDARVSLAQARADLSTARNRLTERTRGQLERDGRAWTWVAPASGTVGEITCSTGELLAAGTSCFRLNTPSRAEVRVAVPERFIAQVDADAKATWRAASQLHTEGGLPMELTRRSPTLDPSSRAQAHYFRPRTEDDDPVELRPGASGRLQIHVDAREGLVRVPKLAVTRIQGRDHVFKKTGDDSQEPIEVETYGQRGEDLLVAGKGLAAGDTIVSHGAFYLKSVLTFE
jgi:cobalt-zinc-cadmium efflux system membrane fusion protein